MIISLFLAADSISPPSNVIHKFVLLPPMCQSTMAAGGCNRCTRADGCLCTRFLFFYSSFNWPCVVYAVLLLFSHDDLCENKSWVLEAWTHWKTILCSYCHCRVHTKRSPCRPRTCQHTIFNVFQFYFSLLFVLYTWFYRQSLFSCWTSVIIFSWA